MHGSSVFVAPPSCGAPAIIDASTTIAAMRQCEAAELSLSGADGDYQVVGDCRGDAVIVQLHLDADGHPLGMASEPALTGDERACIGRLMLDDVDFPASGSERLVAHRYGPVEPEPPTGEPLVATTESSLDEASPPASPDEGEEEPETLQ